MIFHYINYLIR